MVKCSLFKNKLYIDQLKYINKKISKNIRNSKSIILNENISKLFNLKSLDIHYLIFFQGFYFIIYQENKNIIILSAKSNAKKLKQIFNIYEIFLII